MNRVAIHAMQVDIAVEMEPFATTKPLALSSGMVASIEDPTTQRTSCSSTWLFGVRPPKTTKNNRGVDSDDAASSMVWMLVLG